ncbi:MAG TPA: hypothetical protein VD995_22340 [Azospirillum sp.]|nr:hypothetical protein [Azospirillum sp.]
MNAMLTVRSRHGEAPAGAVSAVHSGNMGDVIYALPTLAALKARRLVLNACRDPGVGGRVLSPGMAGFLVPLLLAQPGVEQVDVAEVPVRLAPGFGARARSEVLSEGLPLEHVPAGALGVDHVLDRFRLQPLDRLHLVDAHARAVGKRVNGARPFLHLPEPVERRSDAPIVLSLTPRYRHQPCEFFAALLKGLGPVVMVGLPEDAAVYAGIAGDLVTARDGLELARLIAGARAFVGAPSLPYAIAEGLKVPRLVDVPAFPANAFPLGTDGWAMPASLPAARRLLEAMLDGRERAVPVALDAARDARVAPAAAAMGRVKAYVRLGPHFAEPPAAVTGLALAPVPQRVELALPPQAEPPQAIRFDIGERVGTFDVVALRLLDTQGRELWRLDTGPGDGEAVLRAQPRGNLAFQTGPAGRPLWVNVDGHAWIELPVPAERLAAVRGGGRLVADLRALAPEEVTALLAAAGAEREAARAGQKAARAEAEAGRAEAEAARTAYAETLAERDRARADHMAAMAEVHSLTAQRDALHARIEGIYRSTSWKVSAPLRMAMRLLRRG